MDEDLKRRIRRIYAAVDATEETDLSKFPAHVIKTEDVVSVSQDWRGDMTDEEIENVAHTAIHNVANLHDHLKKWISRRGSDGHRVDEVGDASPSLQIIRDLSNNDKHGYPPRDGGYSKRSPRLQEVRRTMRLSTGTQPNSSAWIPIDPGTPPRLTGSASAAVVITGHVLDSQGNLVGILDLLLGEALTAWETFLDGFSTEWRT